MTTSSPASMPRLQRHAVLVASALALLGALPHLAHAQSSAPVILSVDGNPGVYLTDSSRAVVHSGTGLCVRTGSWSVAGALATKVEGSAFPAGCQCDEPLMPAGACVAPPTPAPVAQMTPPVAPVPVAPPVATADKVTIPSDALFAFDKAGLSAEGRAKLEDFSLKLKAMQLDAVVAVGHTDRIGSPAYNLRLSQERAKSVKDFLVSQGIAAERVFIEGRGETEPVTGADCQGIKGAESGRNAALVKCLAPDRRVVIEAVGSKPRP